MCSKKIKVCTGNSCQKNFSLYILDRIRVEYNKYKDIEMSSCSCQGNCKDSPTVVVEINKEKKIHSKMTPIKAAQLIKKLSGKK